MNSGWRGARAFKTGPRIFWSSCPITSFSKLKRKTQSNSETKSKVLISLLTLVLALQRGSEGAEEIILAVHISRATTTINPKVIYQIVPKQEEEREVELETQEHLPIQKQGPLLSQLPILKTRVTIKKMISGIKWTMKRKILIPKMKLL